MSKLLLKFAAFSAMILPAPVKQAIYRSKPLARLIRRGLNRAAPAGLSEMRVAAGSLAGFTLLLDMHNEKDYWLGTYEPDLQSLLSELILPGAIIYDVGANIGYVSLLLAKAAGSTGRVVAFEALPANVERLRHNLALNNIGSQVTVVPAAVTQSAGPINFLVHESGGMGKVQGSAGRDDRYPAQVTVAGISLDEFVFAQGNPPPQVIKMDIEGGEVLALPGMHRLLAEYHPIMLMELHGPESSRVAWESLTSAGYRVSWMKPGLPLVPSLETMGWKAYIVARSIIGSTG